MSKIDIIDYCGDCSKRYYDVNDLRCEPTGNKTYENAPIPGWCPLKDEKTAQADRQELLAALEKIAHPIKYLQDKAKKDGMKLNGCMTIQLTQDPNFYQEIARAAIAKHKAGKED